VTEHIGFQTRGSNIDIGPISGTIGTNADRASGSAPMIAHVVAPPLTATNDPSRSPQSSEVTAQVHAVLQAQTIAHVDVVGTLSDGAHNGGGLNGQGAYTGRILPVAFDARQTDVCVYGDKSGPLDTDPGTIGVCVTGDRTHALRAEGADASEDGTGRGTPIVTARSVALRGRDGGATAELGDDLGGCLRASTGGGDKPHVLTNMSVRRLTPTECERLQGFPEGQTAIPWKGKPAADCPDGPRYRALGNSMAVPVIAWIARKITGARA
jgi:site-specific DNA-cytosine methylase